LQNYSSSSLLRRRSSRRASSRELLREEGEQVDGKVTYSITSSFTSVDSVDRRKLKCLESV